MTPKTERFELRLDEDTLIRIDGWRTEQPGLPSRSEAIRRLVDAGLEAHSPRNSVHFTDGEKALVGMMADIFQHLKIEGNHSDPLALVDVIYGGHFWAPKWEQDRLFNEHVDKHDEVNFVAEVLEMWWQIELAYSKLSAKDKRRLELEAEPFGKHVRFPGFDANNEGELKGIAHHFIKRMGRWQDFKDHALNSHHPTVPMYQRMLAEFEGMQERLTGRTLSVDELIVLLNAIKARR